MRRTKALEATAYHEAGHAVAAWHQDVRVLGLSIVPDDDADGHISHMNPLHGIQLGMDDSMRARIRVEKLIRVCLGGPLAQRKFKPSGWRKHHGASDFDEAADLALHLEGTGERASALLRLLELQTQDLIEVHWSRVAAVAGALIECDELPGNRVRQIIMTPNR